jgi:ABC-type nitrate/sulfonate/bicarbonate transport system substrate-binding protein
MAIHLTARPLMTRRTFTAGVLAAPIIVATSKRASAADTVSLGMVNTISDAGFFVAEAKGYFKAAGIEVKFLPFTSASAMIPALASGGAAPGWSGERGRARQGPRVHQDAWAGQEQRIGC